MYESSYSSVQRDQDAKKDQQKCGHAAALATAAAITMSKRVLSMTAIPSRGIASRVEKLTRRRPANVGDALDAIETPCLVVDLDAVRSSRRRCACSDLHASTHTNGDRIAMFDIDGEKPGRTAAIASFIPTRGDSTARESPQMCCDRPAPTPAFQGMNTRIVNFGESCFLISHLHFCRRWGCAARRSPRPKPCSLVGSRTCY
jgi:hypothetical protein